MMWLVCRLMVKLDNEHKICVLKNEFKGQEYYNLLINRNIYQLKN